MNMKFQVGDKVKIRTWEDLVEEYGISPSGCLYPPNGANIVPSMKKFCGKETKVVAYDRDKYTCRLEIDGTEWLWAECALLPVKEPKTLPPKKKPVAYISGTITGVEDYKKAFSHAKNTLEENGYHAINPAELKKVLHTEASYEDYMDICLMLLEKADFLVLIPGWERSPGANREMGYAKGLGKDVLTLEECIK